MNNLVASSLLNNIVETMLNNIVGPTMLLAHDNNVIQVLHKQRPCNNLWNFFIIFEWNIYFQSENKGHKQFYDSFSLFQTENKHLYRSINWNLD